MIHRQPKPATPSATKPTLEMVRLAIYRVHYRAFENFVKNVFGLDEFDFLAAAGCSPGQIPEYRVTGELPTESLQVAADTLRRGRRTRDIPLIFNVLAADGFIPTGSYTVDTSAEPPLIVTYTHLIHRHGPQSSVCRAFKSQYASDRKFQQRANKLDQLWLARDQG